MPLTFLLIAVAALGFTSEQPTADFSGIWKQSNNECTPKRTGDVTLKIQHHDPELVVETTSRGLITRHAAQRYATDGIESKSIGADGDEFHSTVVWQDGSLRFTIVEIEDGKRLNSTEVWSLVASGAKLKRIRQTEKSGEQTLIYVRTK